MNTTPLSHLTLAARVQLRELVFFYGNKEAARKIGFDRSSIWSFINRNHEIKSINREVIDTAWKQMQHHKDLLRALNASTLRYSRTSLQIGPEKRGLHHLDTLTAHGHTPVQKMNSLNS